MFFRFHPKTLSPRPCLYTAALYSAGFLHRRCRSTMHGNLHRHTEIHQKPTFDRIDEW
jgi:hypothetical protein